MATTSNQLLTLDEAAEHLKVLPTRLRRWAKQGIAPSVKLPDGEFRFSIADLDEWVKGLRCAVSDNAGGQQ